MKVLSNHYIVVGYLFIGWTTFTLLNGCSMRQQPVYNAAHSSNELVEWRVWLSTTVYNPDWVDYELNIEQVFSSSDLEKLAQYSESIQPLVLDGLKHSGGTHAAFIAGYLQYTKALPILREKLLTLRYPYFWEGSWNYTREDDILNDDQYQYHVAYIHAIERITGKAVKDVITLTPTEIQRLRHQANAARIEEGQSENYCTKWLLNKLGYDILPQNQNNRKEERR
jgi:hypothetical protein